MKKKTTRYDHYCLEYLRALSEQLVNMAERLENDSSAYCAKKEIADDQLIAVQEQSRLVDDAIEGKS